MSAPIPHRVPDIRILDVGGWLSPFMSATHVVDLMPYETRRGQLSLDPLPEEQFTRDTWTQTNFLNANLQFPYDDGYFDFVYCGQTLEDLEDPVPVLREIARVARAGQIVSPSRLSEQTMGIRDRTSNQPGHHHHRWIIDVGDDGLEFCRKSVSISDCRNTVPLTVFEHIARNDPRQSCCDWTWQGRIRWKICNEDIARARARGIVESFRITCLQRWHDAGLRTARRVRDRLFHRPIDDPAAWWLEMLDLSRPYSLIPL